AGVCAPRHDLAGADDVDRGTRPVGVVEPGMRQHARPRVGDRRQELPTGGNMPIICRVTPTHQTIPSTRTQPAVRLPVDAMRLKSVYAVAVRCRPVTSSRSTVVAVIGFDEAFAMMVHRDAVESAAPITSIDPQWRPVMPFTPTSIEAWLRAFEVASVEFWAW